MFYNIKTLYLCIVFFMVLDLRLIEDWVVGRQPFFFLKPLQNPTATPQVPLPGKKKMNKRGLTP